MNLKFLSSMFVILVPLCLSATISLEQDARKLFLPEMINDASVLMEGKYIDFRNGMNACDDYVLRCSLESLIVNAITSIVFSVSTNSVDDSVGIGVLKSRTEYFKKLRFQSVSTNNCISLAYYLNNIQLVQYPSNLVSARLNIYRYRFVVSTNSFGEVKQSLEKIDNRKIYDEKRIQVRVYNANKEIDEFRKLIISICGQGIFTARKTMNDNEFSNFTNQVVRLSNVSKKEQTILFQKLNEGLRSHSKN